jgi:hypothetical protein
MSEIKRIGVMTGGGDCPGLNAVIRAVTKTAISKYGLEVVGIKHGYRGLFLGGDEFINLTLENVSDILSKGGTIYTVPIKIIFLIILLQMKTGLNITGIIPMLVLKTLRRLVLTPSL